MKKGELVYPQHRLRPEDMLTFVQLRPFSVIWDKLGLTDDDLRCLEIAIMCDPLGNPVIPGTKGVRKIRFSPLGWPIGKSGALRACYVYFPAHHTVILALVYPKNQKETLSSEDKNRVNRAISEIEKEFDS